MNRKTRRTIIRNAKRAKNLRKKGKNGCFGKINPNSLRQLDLSVKTQKQQKIVKNNEVSPE